MFTTLTLVLALVLAGCGGSKSGDQTNPGNDRGPGGNTRTEHSDSYYPLKVGLAWTYVVEKGGTTCGAGDVKVTVRETFQEDGLTKFRTDSICDWYGPGKQVTWNNGDGVFTQIRYGSTTSAVSKALKVPPVDGETWAMNHSLNGTWKNVGEVKTQAGTFSDCWRADCSQWGCWAIYCKGVGAVKGGGVNGFSYELKSYEF